MQLHISPSLRHVTVLPTKGVKEFIKFRIVPRRLSFRVVFYSLLLFTFLLRFVFLLTAVDTIDGESKCSGIGNALVLYRHVASNSIPKQLHCLSLMLANEHSSNANARLQLPSPELVPALVDNAFFHFVLASDNVLAASVVASSLVQNSLHPEKFVLHVITDKKTYSQMQAWFSLHPLAPPGLIAFHGHVHVIDSFWHMLGLGYQDNTSIADAASAGVVHFNGRAKPWLDIAFPQLRSLWTKYVNFSDTFIKRCHITAS